MKQSPQLTLNGITTRSPGLMWCTPAPTASTMPIGSWPRMSPSSMNGPNNSYRCRSEPHRPVDVTRMMASVGSWMVGSGTFSTRTSRLPCHVSAFTLRPLPGWDGAESRSPGRRGAVVGHEPAAPAQADNGEDQHQQGTDDGAADPDRVGRLGPRDELTGPARSGGRSRRRS